MKDQQIPSAVNPSASASLPGTIVAGRIPGLDGLRALSISLVLCLHTLQRMSLHHHVDRYWYGIFNGAYGVNIFFEISGFLITNLLLKEQHRNGRISLRDFYLRRAFRIVPPLYLYIGVATLLGMAGLLALDWHNALGAVLFIHNVYAPGPMWSLEHLWSISIEEQFYFVWPFLLVLCLRRYGGSGRYRAAWFPLAVVAVSPLLRVGMGTSHQPMLRFLGMNLFRFDFIMFGCALALLQGEPRFERLYLRLTRLWWAAPLVILLCSLLSTRYGNYFDFSVGYTISGAAIAVSLLWCVRNARSTVGRVLNARPVAYFGIVSYSVYLWQTLWLHEGNERVFAWFPALGRFPLNWLGLLLCAFASFYLVEQPSLRLRERCMGRFEPSLPAPSRIDSA